MSLEQSIQNLADAINNLAKSQQQFATAEFVGAGAVSANMDVNTWNRIADEKAAAEKAAAEKAAAEKAAAEKAAAEKAAAEKAAAEKAAAEKTTKPAKPETPKAVEGELLPANEKTEAEVREEAFGAPNGYIYKPFIALGQGGKNIAAQKAICAQFGVARISLVPLDQIPALKAAVDAALAEVQG